VYYICKRDTGFEAVEKAVGVKNDLGLDLFKHNGLVYEGRTGVSLITEDKLPTLSEYINANGGLPKLNSIIEAQLSKTGESPRYTRSDERKKDIFPPNPAKENTVLAKDAYGKNHYYFRFHDEDGVQLFTRQNAKEYFKTIFVQCEGYMIAVGQDSDGSSLAEIARRVADFENGIKGEIERLFNESMSNPQKWADPCFGEILGRADEAKAHNAPIREAREQEIMERDAELENARIAEKQAAKEKYEKAIADAENTLLNQGRVYNEAIGGKSLIMQLFKEHDISVPLKTQGWIIKSLKDMAYDGERHRVNYHYQGNDSTVFHEYFFRLLAAVKTKQQYEEISQSVDEPGFDAHRECQNEEEDELEL
jgi:hypothetical protein